MKRFLKQFTSENVFIDLADAVNKYAEENDLDIISVSETVVSVRSYLDGRLNHSVNKLTVLFEKKDDK